jgi:hypothetical protein
MPHPSRFHLPTQARNSTCLSCSGGVRRGPQRGRFCRDGVIVRAAKRNPERSRRIFRQSNPAEQYVFALPATARFSYPVYQLATCCPRPSPFIRFSHTPKERSLLSSGTRAPYLKFCCCYCMLWWADFEVLRSLRMKYFRLCWFILGALVLCSLPVAAQVSTGAQPMGSFSRRGQT